MKGERPSRSPFIVFRRNAIEWEGTRVPWW